MVTLAAGLVGAWIAIAAFVGWLGFQQRQLSRRLDTIERMRSIAAKEQSPAKAA